MERFRRLLDPSEDLPQHVREIMQLIHGIQHPWSSFLDFGCGGGEYGVLLERGGLLRDRLYVGADVDWRLLAFFQKEARPAGPLVTIPTQGDLPFRSSSFDVVLASGVLQYVPNWQSCLAELARICAGHVIAARVPVIDLTESLIARQIVEYEAATSVTYLNLFSKAELADTLASSGFSVTKTMEGTESTTAQDLGAPVLSENLVLSVQSLGDRQSSNT